VLIAVADLAQAARQIEEGYGLVSLEGGRHRDWGTANRIVPLGDSYLELVAVVDAAAAASSAFGQWVAGAAGAELAPLGWAVRTRNLPGIVIRHGLEVTVGSRITRDGRVLRWRLAGIEEAAAEPFLPFFIEWGRGTPFPGRSGAGRGSDPPPKIVQLQVLGDPERLADWIGPDRLPVLVRLGTPSLTSVVLSGADGERMTLP
jgi:Glyoxalase-like domain